MRTTKEELARKKTGGEVGVELGWTVGNTVFGQKRTTQSRPK